MNQENSLKCTYCWEPFDQHYWSLPLNAEKSKMIGSFCTPECMLAYNRYINDTRSPIFDANQREQWLNFSRCVNPAPQPYEMKRWNPERGLVRDQWLPNVRSTLNQHDFEIASNEMSLTFNLVEKKKPK